MTFYPSSDRNDLAEREVVEGVYRFGTRRINWYVLEAVDGLTVIDAGLPGHWPQLTGWLDENDYEINDITSLVLTHADVDHVGFASKIAEHDIPVYCHPDDLPLLQSHPQRPPNWFFRNLWRPRFMAYAIEMIRDGVRAVDPPTDVEPLADDMVLPVPGNPRVIFAPGHTPGSCALVLDDRDVLFCGDVLATRNIFTGREGGPQLLGSADEDHEEAKASLMRLEHLGRMTLLPGHGNPRTGEVTEAINLVR